MESGVPYGDYAWYYCDLKCLYLHNYHPNATFVWIDFTPNWFLGLRFAACFVEIPPTAAGKNATYELWNTVIKNNTFYNTHCGGDTVNYWN